MAGHCIVIIGGGGLRSLTLVVAVVALSLLSLSLMHGGGCGRL